MNDKQITEFYLGQLSQQTGEACMKLDTYIKSADIPDLHDEIMLLLQMEDIIISSSDIIILVKTVLKDLYWKYGLSVSLTDIMELTIEEHLNIIETILNVKHMDQGTALYISNKITTNAEDIDIVFSALSAIDNGITIDMIYNLVKDVRGIFITYIKESISDVINNVEPMFGNDIDYALTDKTQEALIKINVANIPDLLLELLNNNGNTILLINTNKTSLISLAYKELLLAPKHMENYKAIVTKTIITLLVIYYITDKDNYKTQILYKLKDIYEDDTISELFIEIESIFNNLKLFEHFELLMEKNDVK